MESQPAPQPEPNAAPRPQPVPETVPEPQPSAAVEPIAVPEPMATADTGQRSQPTTMAASTSSSGDEIAGIRSAWPQIVAAISINPANRPLVTTCRPVEVRDGFLILGFPEDQAFMRDIADRKKRILEDGIASVVGRSVAVRCVVTNLELVEPVDSGEGDLVAQAQRIFGGELAGVEDVD